MLNRLNKAKIDIPFLFIQALKDNVLTPTMSQGMEEHFPKMTRREVAASHWALSQAPAEVNGIIKDWLEATLYGGTKSIL